MHDVQGFQPAYPQVSLRFSRGLIMLPPLRVLAVICAINGDVMITVCCHYFPCAS